MGAAGSNLGLFGLRYLQHDDREEVRRQGYNEVYDQPSVNDWANPLKQRYVRR
jgi:hypothetical protein